jgi:hypothetical protein
MASHEPRRRTSELGETMRECNSDSRNRFTSRLPVSATLIARSEPPIDTVNSKKGQQRRSSAIHSAMRGIRPLFQACGRSSPDGGRPRARVGRCSRVGARVGVNRAYARRWRESAAAFATAQVASAGVTTLATVKRVVSPKCVGRRRARGGGRGNISRLRGVRYR